MKVALLLYGQPRFVQRKDVFMNHRELVIEPYGAKVYAQMWFSPNARYTHLPSWVQNKNGWEENPPIPHTAPRNVLDYNPERMLVEKPITNPLSSEVISVLNDRFQGNEFFSETNMINIRSQCKAIENACNLLKPDKNHVDIVVMARYDAKITQFPDLNEIDPSFFHLPEGGHFNDLVHVFGVDFLDVFDGLADAIDTVELNQEVELPIPEMYKYFWFRRKGLLSRMKKLPMYAHVIRR